MTSRKRQSQSSLNSERTTVIRQSSYRFFMHRFLYLVVIVGSVIFTADAVEFITYGFDDVVLYLTTAVVLLVGITAVIAGSLATGKRRGSTTAATPRKSAIELSVGERSGSISFLNETNVRLFLLRQLGFASVFMFFFLLFVNFVFWDLFNVPDLASYLIPTVVILLIVTTTLSIMIWFMVPMQAADIDEARRKSSITIVGGD